VWFVLADEGQRRLAGATSQRRGGVQSPDNRQDARLVQRAVDGRFQMLDVAQPSYARRLGDVQFADERLQARADVFDDDGVFVPFFVAGV